jgi:hypothetical protein
VPFWLPPATAQGAISIGVLESGPDGASHASRAEFDAYVVTERAKRADPCEEFARRLPAATR